MVFSIKLNGPCSIAMLKNQRVVVGYNCSPSPGGGPSVFKAWSREKKQATPVVTFKSWCLYKLSLQPNVDLVGT